MMDTDTSQYAMGTTMLQKEVLGGQKVSILGNGRWCPLLE